MARHVPATLLAVACWGRGAGFRAAVRAGPSARTSCGDARPVNTAPSQPEKPVKLEVSETAPEPVASEAPGKGDAREDDGQRGGGRGRGGGGGGREPSGGGWRGGSSPKGSSRTPWVGGGWPAPVYVARPYYYDPFWARRQVESQTARGASDGRRLLAGAVDEFDGVFQSLRLAPGGPTIEVRLPASRPSPSMCTCSPIAR